MNTLLENVPKYVQDKQRVPRKLDVLSISSLAEMDTFKNIDDSGGTLMS